MSVWGCFQNNNEIVLKVHFQWLVVRHTFINSKVLLTERSNQAVQQIEFTWKKKKQFSKTIILFKHILYNLGNNQRQFVLNTSCNIKYEPTQLCKNPFSWDYIRNTEFSCPKFFVPKPYSESFTDGLQVKIMTL